MFDIELFFFVVYPFVKAASAEGLGPSGLFAPLLAKFSQIGRWCGVAHGLTLHKSSCGVYCAGSAIGLVGHRGYYAALSECLRCLREH